MTLVEKYRPKNWDEVFGNDWIKEVLQRMIENDTVQHMMFVGAPGCGRRWVNGTGDSYALRYEVSIQTTSVTSE